MHYDKKYLQLVNIFHFKATKKDRHKNQLQYFSFQSLHYMVMSRESILFWKVNFSFSTDNGKWLFIEHLIFLLQQFTYVIEMNCVPLCCYKP